MDPAKDEDSDGTPAMGPDVSIVLTAHGEGRLAHRSVRSARRAVVFATERGVRVEFVAVLDSPGPETLAWFDGRREEFDAVHRVGFRDPAQTRNAGVELCRGRYVAFLDADDLFSANWIDAAFRMAEGLGGGSGRFVLHAAQNVIFGMSLMMFEGVDATDPGFDPLNLLQDNYWTAMVFVPRTIMREIPYQNSVVGSGFGHEDWHWNCEAIAAGVQHRVVPRTAHFIRRKPENSRLEAHTSAGSVIRPSRLFRPPLPGAARRPESPPEPLPSRAPPRPPRARSPLLYVAGAAYKAVRFPYRLLMKPHLRSPDRIGRFVHAQRAAFRDLVSAPGGPARPPACAPSPGRQVPDWLIDEWRAINDIEPGLCPERQVTPELDWYEIRRPTIVEPYVAAQGVRPEAPSHVFLVPSCAGDGAGPAFLAYAQALTNGGLDRGILLVLTEDGESSRPGTLPPGVGVVPLGRLGRSLSPEDRAELLLQVLLQRGPAVIHNFDTAIGYEVFGRYGTALRQQSRLYASVSRFERHPDGTQWGPVLENLDRCFDHLTGVLADNRAIVDHVRGLYDLDAGRFHLHYAPVAISEAAAPPPRIGGPLRVLWVGRFDRGNRPDVLLDIADRCRALGLPVEFHVRGSAPADPDRALLARLRATPNARHEALVDDVGAVLRSRPFDAFLCTSESGGIPGVLLRAMAAGLPCIAPGVGGIPELITPTTGFLVGGTECVDGYVDHLRRVLEHPEDARAVAEGGLALLRERHSPEAFLSRLKALAGYCVGA